MAMERILPIVSRDELQGLVEDLKGRRSGGLGEASWNALAHRLDLPSKKPIRKSKSEFQRDLDKFADQIKVRREELRRNVFLEKHFGYTGVLGVLIQPDLTLEDLHRNTGVLEMQSKVEIPGDKIVDSAVANDLHWLVELIRPQRQAVLSDKELRRNGM